MVNAIPVSARVSIIKDKKSYSNNNIKATATSENLLAFAGALGALRDQAPADKYLYTVKYELKEA